MNAQIIRYLALNGPALIYSVAQDLSSRSETKVHYPTVNRRMHELLEHNYLEKAGTRMTKAGVPADLYAVRLRGDFAALAGIPGSSGGYSSDLSPKEMRQLVNVASLRKGSPFVLFRYLLDEGQSGSDLVDRVFVPEIINSVRNGYLNIDAPDEGAMCSAFASLVAREMTGLMALLDRRQSPASRELHKDQVEILMRSLDKTMVSPRPADARKAASHYDGILGPTDSSRLSPVTRQWANELKVFLKLHSVIS